MASGFKRFFYEKVIPRLARGIPWLVMAATACIPDPLEVTGIPQLEPKIVVSSQMIPGLAIAVLLTKSVGALEASEDSDPQELLSQIVIEDAEVTIEGIEATYQLQYIGNGLYGVAGASLVLGRSYTLLVNSPSLGTVEASTTVKPVVPFNDIETSIHIIGRDTLAQVDYSIADIEGKNWYMITAQRITQRNLEDRLLNPWVTTELLDDATFEGTIKRDSFKMLFDEVKEGDTLAVMLSNVDKDYYDFMKVREDTRFGLASYLGEPINYPSNVEGGLGFFNLYFPDVRVFVLGEEE